MADVQIARLYRRLLRDWTIFRPGIGAPFFSAPISAIMNLSMSSSIVPKQWKVASIMPVAKIPTPLSHSDYRPISITPFLSRWMERVVVTDYIYPSFLSPPPNLHPPQLLFLIYSIGLLSLLSSIPKPLCYRVYAGFFKSLQ